jgi:hypothetical protein
MPKKLVLFCLVVLSLSAAAQNPQNTQKAPAPVEGIWIFKIGKSSVEVTNQVATELNTTIKLAKTSREMFRSADPAIFELERNTDGDKKRPSRAPYCEGVRVFYINEYKVGKVIVLRDMYLTFKNGILIQLFSDQPEGFIPPFTSVHGQGSRSTKTDPITCRYEGKTETMSTAKYVDQWDSGAIKAANVQAHYYDQDCQRRKDMFFEVYAQQELTEALSCENQSRAKFGAAKLTDLDL